MYIATHIEKTFWLCCMHGLVVTWVMQKSSWFCCPASIPLFVNAYFFFLTHTHPPILVNISKPLHLTFDQNITTLLCYGFRDIDLRIGLVWASSLLVSTAILAILNNKMLEIHMTLTTFLHFMETHVKVSAVKVACISLHYW